jgi:hypothetical protein
MMMALHMQVGQLLHFNVLPVWETGVQFSTNAGQPVRVRSGKYIFFSRVLRPLPPYGIIAGSSIETALFHARFRSGTVKVGHQACVALCVGG